ncbi:MAG: type II secretion system protein [Fibrobacter sp.]|jgi:prepilin-type N-terminal cleavage/methylation domain-containing protein|nr:type II secretion system protein [Fibrobacter sp.]MBQ5464555.1 type II secretion system protein [Fibrobacter sp.]
MRIPGKLGFTLIELVTTIAISGAFFTMAMNLYGNANKAFATDKKYDELYFEYNALKARTERFLREHPDFCERSEKYQIEYNLPFKPLSCKPLDKKRYLVYFQGYMDPTRLALVGFSTIVGE